MEGICLALFTRALGWTKEEVDMFLIRVKSDMKKYPNSCVLAVVSERVLWEIESTNI